MCACTCTFIPFFSCHVRNASQGLGHLIGQVITMTSSLLLFRFFRLSVFVWALGHTLFSSAQK